MVRGLAFAMMLWGSQTALSAQDTAAVGRPVAEDERAVPRLPLTVDGARLQAGTHAYDVMVTGDSGARFVGRQVISVVHGSFAGQPAWAVVDERVSQAPFTAIVAADTVRLDHASLRPLRWDATVGDARFVAAFTRDSMYGGATSPHARQTFTAAAPGVTVTSEGVLDVLLRSAPLHATWSTQATMLVIDLGGSRSLPLELTVERDEHLELAGHPFDVWVVRARAGGTERTLWVEKHTQVVVRTATSSAHMPGMIVERVLALFPEP